MPVEFLTGDQAEVYGKFAEEPTRPELERFFFLDDVDRPAHPGGARRQVGAGGAADGRVIRGGGVRRAGRPAPRTAPQNRRRLKMRTGDPAG
ncbi:hypothetical protein [Streptomyces sp. XD-27]|uniref:hypothetical protein n=1 Tax=Streptomyces sp. XD-27 TaxID=3062779 RepID=UPI0026F42A89|nr:hypothetical protein [Streptomyces sp. XD-27]WKX74056.1 hypothetical protein Q3Y56_33085 [Streptomyces sp. XD-27]